MLKFTQLRMYRNLAEKKTQPEMNQYFALWDNWSNTQSN